jgi:transketolase
MSGTTPYEETLASLCAQRDDIVVLTAENRAAIRSLPARLGSRFVDVGICEQTMVGAAAGLALRGRRPVVHALSTFLTMRAFEFIRTDVGLPNLPVLLVGYIPGLLSEANGPTHQALEDVALMRGIPNMKVFCPSDQEELCGGLPALLASDGPCYVRYIGTPAVAPHAPFGSGRAELLLPGAGVVTILSYGLLVREALGAARLLEQIGLPARVVNLRMLKPVDEHAILEAARAELLVTLEDHFLTGGLHSIVAEVLLRHGRSARTLALGFDERFFHPALLEDVLEHEGLSAVRVAERILRALRPDGSDLPHSSSATRPEGRARATAWPME